MVVLDEHAVVEAEAVVAAAPAATAYFSSARRPGVVLRVSRIAAPGAGDRVDVALRQRRDAGESAEEVERHPLAGEDRALGPCYQGHGGRPIDDGAFSHERLEANIAIERAKDGLGDAEPADDAGLLDEELGRADGLGRDGGLGRDVAFPDVLRECRRHDPLQHLRAK